MWTHLEVQQTKKNKITLANDKTILTHIFVLKMNNIKMVIEKKKSIHATFWNLNILNKYIM